MSIRETLQKLGKKRRVSLHSVPSNQRLPEIIGTSNPTNALSCSVIPYPVTAMVYLCYQPSEICDIYGALSIDTAIILSYLIYSDPWLRSRPAAHGLRD